MLVVAVGNYNLIKFTVYFSFGVSHLASFAHFSLPGDVDIYANPKRYVFDLFEW